MWWKKNPKRIEPKFCLAVDIRDVITWFKFGNDRLSGFGSAEGQSLPFFIDFDGRPYNTLTNVWECGPGNGGGEKNVVREFTFYDF